jgi:hypothetical protein
MNILWESGMKRSIPILLAVLALVFASLSCLAVGPETSMENLRMSYDENGDEVTSTFSDSDVFYAVVDLSNATQDTVVKAVWTAVDAADTDPEYEIQEQALDITEESFSGSIYFQLLNDDAWPTGRYRIDLYLNDTPAQSIEFSVE